MSVPPETMEQQLLQGLFQQEPDNEDRLRALRRQGAIGTLATLGGANLAPMGQGMVQSAASERKDMDAQRNKGLARSVAQIQGLKGLKDLQAQDETEWQIKADPVGGGFVRFNPRSGEVQAVEGYGPGSSLQGTSGQGPQVGKLTEKQAAALNAGRRIASNLPILNEVMQSGYDPSRIDATWQKFQGSSFAEMPLSMVASDDGKRFYTAGRDILAAILRKESGAAITADEWTQFAPLWLPWPGDTPKQREEKMTRLSNQMESAAIEAGPEGGRHINWYAGQQGKPKGGQPQQGQTQQGQTGDIIDLPPPR